MNELVIVSAENDATLVSVLTKLIDFIDRVPDVGLTDFAYTCAKMSGESRVAIVATDITDLRARLFSVRSRLETGTSRKLKDKSGTYYFKDHLLGEGKGRLAFLYSGVTGFYPDMLRDLTISSAECRGAFEELEEAMRENPEFTPSSFIFPPASYYRHDADIFRSGAYAQALVATYAGNVALTRILRRMGIVPTGVVGFAGGDLAAMMNSGAAGEKPTREDRVGVVREIYNIVDKAVNHGGLPETVMITTLMRKAGEIDEIISAMPKDKVRLAVDFSPRQQTFAITPDFANEFVERMQTAGVRTMRLPLDRPFNTELCESLVPAIRKFAVKWMKHPTVMDVYSCASAGRLDASLKMAREDTACRWATPVRFTETIRNMHNDGFRVFLEVGPRGLMTAAVEDTLKNSEHAAIAMNSIHRSGRQQLLHALGQLAALGANLNLEGLFETRQARLIDFDAAISMEVRRDSEMRLSRRFPTMTILSNETIAGAAFLSEPKGRGAKAAARAAAVAQQARRQRQFDFGAMNPLVSDADVIASSPGVSIEISKTFKIKDLPFIGDFAMGSSQLSYSDPNLRGLVALTIPVGMEIMAELASQVVPKRHILRVENFTCKRIVSFERGELTLFVRAERVAANVGGEIAVKVQLRDDSPNSAYTWPVMETTFVLADHEPEAVPAKVEPLFRPRSVHWSSREIYPVRLCCGKRLRGVNFVDAWSESGLDYEVIMPPLSGNVVFTRFPIWAINPLLMGMATSGFALWRSHERFAGAFSFPFRFRMLSLGGTIPKEGAKLRCYMRLTGVTPKSHLSDITITDGNGQEVAAFSGWEELTQHVPSVYREMIMQPANTFLTEPISRDMLGDPATDVASAYITDVPYAMFERHEELWLRILSRVVLGADEAELQDKSGSVSRRTEWLFGRIAAKEAVRRYLKDFHQARWSDADVTIWQDDNGKPHALGAWCDHLTSKIDIGIAHTDQFVIAVAAANAKVGVDVESTIRNLSDEFAVGVFAPDEIELAAQTSNSSQTFIRFWCAKEAVSKALGTGIRYSPKEMTITKYDEDSGMLSVQLTASWLGAFKNFKGRDIRVKVRTLKDHALAFCFIPATMLNDDGF